MHFYPQESWTLNLVGGHVDGKAIGPAPVQPSPPPPPPPPAPGGGIAGKAPVMAGPPPPPPPLEITRPADGSLLASESSESSRSLLRRKRPTERSSTLAPAWTSGRSTFQSGFELQIRLFGETIGVKIEEVWLGLKRFVKTTICNNHPNKRLQKAKKLQ